MALMCQWRQVLKGGVLYQEFGPERKAGYVDADEFRDSEQRVELEDIPTTFFHFGLRLKKGLSFLRIGA